MCCWDFGVGSDFLLNIPIIDFSTFYSFFIWGVGCWIPVGYYFHISHISISRWCSIFWIIWWFLSDPKESLGVIGVNREYSISWQGMEIVTVCWMFMHWKNVFLTWSLLCDLIHSQPRLKMLLDWDSKRFLEQLKTSSDTCSDKLNSEILICLFHRWLEALVKAVPENVCSTLFNYGYHILLLLLLKKCHQLFLQDSELWLSKPEKLFIFFASQFGHVSESRTHFLVLNCKIFSPKFLAKMFTEEGFLFLVFLNLATLLYYLSSLGKLLLSFLIMFSS